MLLRQAKSEGIVTYLSNLFDTFFEGGKDHRVDKPSVLHMPYFEGKLVLSYTWLCSRSPCMHVSHVDTCHVSPHFQRVACRGSC